MSNLCLHYRSEYPICSMSTYEDLLCSSSMMTHVVPRIFAAYGQMDVSVQQAIQELITALIRSLGPSHGKLLTLLRTFPQGAESLALRVLTIFTENGRPSATLVALVKGLISERDLDARFLIPIIAEMDKVSFQPLVTHMVAKPGPGGHSPSSPAHRLYAKWTDGTEKPCSLRLRGHRHHASADIWQCHIESASSATK